MSYVLRRPVLSYKRLPRLRTPSATSINPQSLSYSTRASASINVLASGLPYLLGTALFTAGALGLMKGLIRSSGEAEVASESAVHEILLQDGVMKVSPPREVLKKHPVTKNVVSQDNLVRHTFVC